MSDINIGRYIMNVEFPPKDEMDHLCSADALIDDILFEMKAGLNSQPPT